MLSIIAKYNVNENDRDARHGNCLLLFGVGMVVCILAMCIPGCSRSEATSSEAHTSPPIQSIFFHSVETSKCSAQCIPATLAIGKGGLGLDTEERTGDTELSANAIFELLEKEGREVGSAIARVPVEDVIEKMTEGPAIPVVLVHKSGHLYVLFGAIQVNDKLLCQLVHGSEPVSLVTKQAILEGDFQEAWRLEKKEGTGVPIHVGNAVLEINKLWHNFGETFPDKSLACTFHLKNVGSKSVIIDKPVVSCQCTVPNLTAKTELAPGNVRDITFEIRPTGLTSLRNSVLLNIFEQGTGISRRINVSLIGSQRVSMEVSPEKLDFGLLAPGELCSRVACLREATTDRFVLENMDSGSLPISHKIERVKDKDGLSTYHIHLELRAETELTGKRQGKIILTTNSVVRPVVTIPVEYRIAPPIQAIPSVVSLGTIAVGEHREGRVQFVSRDGKPPEVQIESKPDECSVKLDAKKNPPEMVVVVTLKKAGIWRGTIKVKLLPVASGEEMMEIRCVGYGKDRGT